MSAGIKELDVNFTCSINDDPWHRKGSVIPIADIAEQYRQGPEGVTPGYVLDWFTVPEGNKPAVQYNKVPLYYPSYSAEEIASFADAEEITTHPEDVGVFPKNFASMAYLTYANGTVESYPMGPIGKVYRHNAISQIVQAGNSLFADADLGFCSWGTLFDLSRIYACARLGETIVGQLPNGQPDTLTHYLTLSTSVDGSIRTRGSISTVRAVCYNTVTWGFITSSSRFSLKHAGGMEERTETAVNELLGFIEESEAIDTVAQTLAEESITHGEAEEIIEAWLGEKDENASRTIQNRREEAFSSVYNLFIQGQGNRGQTKWDLYNGMTEYLDHTASLVRRSKGNEMIAEERRFSDLVVSPDRGNIGKAKQNALDIMIPDLMESFKEEAEKGKQEEAEVMVS